MKKRKKPINGADNYPQYPYYPPSASPMVIETGKKGWLNTLTDSQRKIVNTTLIILGSLGISYLAYKFAKRQYDKMIRADVESKSLGEGKHETWAKQFRLAFLNDYLPGTKVSLVRSTMREIPSKDDFKLVEKKYKSFDSMGLVRRMTDELTTTEFQEMLAIQEAKPQSIKKGETPQKVYNPKSWAKRIRAGITYTTYFGIPSTDNDAIKAVLIDIPTQRAFYQTYKAYKTMYGSDMYGDLDSEFFAMDYRAMLKKKPLN